MLAIREPSKRSKSNYPASHAPAVPQHRAPDPYDSLFSSFHPPALMDSSPFASMSRMMDQMHHMANEVFRGFDMMSAPSMNVGPGQFYSQTFVQSSKIGADGRPVVEKYRSEAKGRMDSNHGLIGERKQAYAHSGTGLEKYGHEQMIGNQGRKVVKEKRGSHERQSDVYKNLNEADVPEFDRRFQQFFGGNALPAPSGNLYGNMGRVIEDEEERYMDDRRRGDYIPHDWRGENRPVRRNDIQPTVPAIRAPPRVAQPPAPRRVPNRNTVERRTPAAGS